MSRGDFDPYEVLGIDPSATPEQIRAAYREMIGRYHPDKHQGNPLAQLAQEKMRDVNRAFEMLSNNRGSAPYRDVSATPRSAQNRSPSTRQARTMGSRSLASWLVYGLGLVVLFRFGLPLARQAIAIVQALVGVILRLGTFGPVLAFILLFSFAMLAGWWLRRRKAR